MDIFDPFRKIPAGRLRASLEKENVLLAFIRNVVGKLRRTSGKIKNCQRVKLTRALYLIFVFFGHRFINEIIFQKFCR